MNMTIDEIKSVSIYNWMKENGYGDGAKKGKNIFYCSPLRSEATPSFVVNTDKNLWHDFGTGKGGNLINLVEQLNLTWTEHQVLGYLEQQIKKLGLLFNEDYNARLEEEEKKRQWIEGKKAENEEKLNQETVVEMIIPLSHPRLRDYVLQRRIDYNIAQRYCKEVHYSLRGKSYFAIAFENISNGMEARNKFNKRCIGKKSISVVHPTGTQQKECCIFEGFFDMLTYMTLETWMPDIGVSVGKPCDLFVLNGVGEVKLLLPYLKDYDSIHCYLDNDEAGRATTKTIMAYYPDMAIDESYRYKDYGDLNDFLSGTK
jgi:DNA primase